MGVHFFEVSPTRFRVGLIQASGLMRHISAVLLLAAATQVLASDKCPVTEHGLVGSWKFVGGTGFFDEFTLSTGAKTRRFDSWLHQRPDISGAVWSLENCELVVTAQREATAPFRLKVISLERDNLRLRDTSEQAISVYQRIRDER